MGRGGRAIVRTGRLASYGIANVGRRQFLRLELNAIQLFDNVTDYCEKLF